MGNSLSFYENLFDFFSLFLFGYHLFLYLSEIVELQKVLGHIEAL